MPTIFARDGYRVMIYTRDHPLMHVHVIKREGKAKIEFDPEIKVLADFGLNRNKVRTAVSIVEKNLDLLIKKWREIHG